jgi:glutamine synthetase
MLKFAEYIWIDGTEPVQKLRSKTRVIENSSNKLLDPNFPVWNFDGSSTNQAKGDDSECILQPVRSVKNPLKEGGYLVLCEVKNADDSSHSSNKRALLRKALKKGGRELETLWGFEQEYCLVNNETDTLLGWPAGQKYYPKPQGAFYCGVGADEVVGRDIVNEHAQACLDAGLLYYGKNYEVMLSQCEFQVGYRGFDQDPLACPLLVSDHLWLSRYLLYRVSEKYNVYATLDTKPKKGDWNGSGMHTNFSDKFLRNEKVGLERIEDIRKIMKKNHFAHQEVYGYKNRERLTGLHETAHYDEFSMGRADRGSSIRIPNQTAKNGYGYLEDRRVGSNACPYIVSARILNTLLEIDK